jgi:DNA-binding NarL/FixJ family response regulator
MTRIKVLIVEDHTLLSKLIVNYISTISEIEVIGSATNGEKALDYLLANQVDVVLLDLNLPKVDGLDFLEMISSRFPDVKILVLSSCSDSSIIRVALNSGAMGYLTKTAELSEVIIAIKSINNGKSYCSNEALQALSNANYGLDSHELNVSQKLARLTKREKEILDLISNEMTSNEIANKLHISVRTVETHRKNISTKLDVKNSIGLSKFSLKIKLLSSEMIS